MLEINPVTLELVWFYTNPRFFSTNISGAQRLPNGNTLIITAADCTAERLGTSVATSAIGEPVRSVTVSALSWVEAGNGVAAHCRVNGSMVSMDANTTARPINFCVVLPATWSRRAAQLGGGGMNGFVPNLTGGGPGASGPSLLDRGFATYGSDSGHQVACGGELVRVFDGEPDNEVIRAHGRTSGYESNRSAPVPCGPR